MTEVLDGFQRHSLITSMFFPQSRLMVAGNPKAAGTSLRWWLLTAHDVPVSELTANSLWRESAPYQTVWDTRIDLRYTWNDLSESERTQAIAAEDVLTVLPIRHPVTRAFSAWSGKYLNREPYYTEQLPESFPRPAIEAQTREGVAAMFESFVHALATQVAEHTWRQLDVHFWPQYLLLGRDPVGPSLVLRQESMAAGITALTAHLRDHGIDAGTPPRINETIVPYQPDLVTDAALRSLRDLYHEDFGTWDYPAERPDAPRRDIDFAWLSDVRGRNGRYQVVHDAATRALRREQQLAADLERARTREAELLNSTSWRLTRPVRAVSEVFRRDRRTR